MRNRWIAPLVLAALCAASFAQAWLSLRQKSLTFDEVTYIPAGYSYVVTGDHRLNPEHPPLMKLLAGVALLPLGPRLDTSHPSWVQPEQWSFGADFFVASGVDIETLVSTARLPTVLLLVALVIAAYGLARDLYGPRAGLLAAFLCAFSPNLLAHGRLATNDLGLACFVLLTLHATQRMAMRPTPLRVAAAGIALGLALLTKFTAVLLLGLVPLWAVALALVEGGASASPPPRWLERIGNPRARRVASASTAAAASVVVALLVVTLAYRTPGDLGPYLAGLSVLYSNVHVGNPTYFAGTFHPGGVPYYFAAVFLLKTPTPFLALLGLRAGEQVARRRAEPKTLVLLLLPALLWLLVISATAFQFGVRYILPIYPILFVYAAGVASSPLLERPWARVGVAALVALFAAASLRAHPHYLPYFNALAGGPDRGIHWLDDSNVDWGQDLPLLARWLDEHGVTDVTIAPMAWYDPGLYGVRGRRVAPPEMLRLLGDPDAPPGPYAVSAHLLTRARIDPSASFDPLTDLEPVAVLGHSIYVFER